LIALTQAKMGPGFRRDDDLEVLAPRSTFSALAHGIALLAFAVVLTACTATRRPSPPALLVNPALSQPLRALLCRVEPACGLITLQLLDRPNEQAEVFPDGRLQLSMGLLLATQSEAEIAFILAHETAHRRLRHSLAATPEARTALELAADADAVRALGAAGFTPHAGALLMQRLLEAAQREHDGITTTGASPSPRQQEALAQMQARLAALHALTIDDQPPVNSPHADWPQLLAPYRSKLAPINVQR